MQKDMYMIQESNLPKYMITIVLLLFSEMLFPQNGGGYEIIIDDDYHSSPSCIINYDSNIILTGFQRPLNSIYGSKTCIYKINNWGDTTSMHYSIGYDSTVFFKSVIRLTNNHLLVFGAYGKIEWTNKQTNAIMVLELDSELNILCRKNYPLPQNYWDPLFKVSITEDSTIYLAGSFKIDGISSLERLFLMKFDTQGDTLMTKFPDYPIGNPTRVYDIMNRENSNGILAYATGFSYEVLQVLEIDSCFNMNISDIIDPLNSICYNFNVKPFTDSTYLMSSDSYESGNKNKITNDIQVDIMSYEHEFLTRRFLGRPDTSDIPAWINAIDFTDKNNIWVFGALDHLPSDPIYAEAFVYLLDSTLEVKGLKYFEGDISYNASLTNATPDGGCVLGGFLTDWQNNQSGDMDIWIKKVFPEDILTNAEDTPDPNDRDVLVYPNPFTDKLIIKTIRKGLKFSLFTINGITVLETKIENNMTFELNASILEKGTYIYKITYKNRVIQTDKLIKF